MKYLLANLFGKSPGMHDKISRNQWSMFLDVLGYLGCVTLVIYIIIRWGPNYFDPYLQNDDARIAIFPFWSFHEDLFKGDYIAQAMSAYTPWLHKTFYYLLTFVFDLLTVTKILQIAAISWGGFHAFRIGHRRSGGLGGLFSIYLVFHTYVLLERAGGGHPRAFALPIILMTIDGIDQNSEKQSGLGAVLGFAIYPTAGLIALSVHSIWLAIKCVINKSNWLTIRISLVSLGLIIFLCFLFVAPSLISNKEYGKVLLLRQARHMPEVGVNGRYKLIPLPKASVEIEKNFEKLSMTSGDSPLPFLEHFTNESGGAPLYFFVCFALLLSIVGLARPPCVSLYVAIGGIILFSLAILFAFRLYLPERIILYALPPTFLYLLLSTYTGIGYDSFGGIISRISSLIAILVFIAFFGIAFKGPIGLTVNAHPEKELFQLLQTLPEDALFSGHPLRINNIPLWAKRRILVSYETSQIFYDKAWKEIKGRTYDNFEAYYASDLGPLKVLRRKYGVDYMLIYEADISSFYAKYCHYFDPFNKYLSLLCRKPSKELIWRKATPQSIVGRASGFYVIDIETFLKQFADTKQ